MDLSPEDVEYILSVLKSLLTSESNSEYRKYLPDVINQGIDNVLSIEEKNLLTLSTDTLVKDFEKYKKSIRFVRSKHKFKGYPIIEAVPDSTKKFEMFLTSLIKSGRLLEVLRAVSYRRYPVKPPLVPISGEVSEIIIDKVLQHHGVSSDFLDFFLEENGRKYFNVKSKLKIVRYLAEQSRYEDMYRLVDIKSKMVNAEIAKLARRDDLPFILAASGISTKKTLEYRLNKMK